jgi:subtilisin family serine protease
MPDKLLGIEKSHFQNRYKLMGTFQEQMPGSGNNETDNQHHGDQNPVPSINFIPTSTLRFPDKISINPIALDDAIQNDVFPAIKRRIFYKPAMQKFGNPQGKGECIAILDTGVDASHPDLMDAVRLSIDYRGNRHGDIRDQHGHGTHIAGLIAGRGVVIKRLAGIAPEASVLSIKITDGAASETSWWKIDRALELVLNYLDNPPDELSNLRITAVNLSFNAFDNLPNETEWGHHSVCRRIMALADKKIPVINSAGNYFAYFKGKQGVAYPGYLKNVFTAGAVDNYFGEVASKQIDDNSQRIGDRRIACFLAVPAAYSISCDIVNGKNYYSAFGGTSQSAAILSGCILLMQQNASKKSGAGALYRLPLHEIRNALLINSDRTDVDAATGERFPLLNLAKSLAFINATP